MDYQTTLIDSRQGVNLTVQEAKEMAAIIGPLLRQGQSPYQIVTEHPELGISEKTLYNYIEGGQALSTRSFGLTLNVTF